MTDEELKVAVGKAIMCALRDNDPHVIESSKSVGPEHGQNIGHLQLVQVAP